VRCRFRVPAQVVREEVIPTKIRTHGAAPCEADRDALRHAAKVAGVVAPHVSPNMAGVNSKRIRAQRFSKTLVTHWSARRGFAYMTRHRASTIDRVPLAP
jgi:hypothetical protein